MQPTATMATEATTTATVALTTSWDNATSRPTAEPDPILDNYVLLVVVMSLFIGGTLVVLSGVLLLCKRCWEVHQRFNRAMDEAEKTTTTYLDNGTHPIQDPDCRGEDPESQDTETERFLATSSTGRRVSFNEAALFEQSHKAQDKGRRYTLTEGDFHHLKNARLTHLHLPPLKIATIHECDPGEASSVATPHPATTPKDSLAIFQPPGKALTGHAVGPSSALPGDPYNSVDFSEISPSGSSDSGEGTSLDAGARGAKAAGPGPEAAPGEMGTGSSGPGTVLQFFTRLRRHASLDGASPYFKVKKWKLESSQRASSLDTRGGPGTALLALWTRTRVTLATSWGPPLQRRPEKEEGNRESLGKGRLEASEAAGGASPETPPEHSIISLGPEHAQQQDPQQEQDAEHAQCSYRDLWSLRTSLELNAATASDHSSSGNDRDSVRSGDSSGSGSGGGGPAPAFPPPPESPPALRPKDGEARRLLQMDSGYASIEGRGAGDEASELPAPTRSPPRSPRAWPRRPRRDYSIDEKTDALFHEFLRHDPHFDDAPRHRARAHPHAHARKQWQQRGRQHSDPGGARAATPPGAVRPARAPLRRGDSVDCPPEGRALPTAGDDPSIPVIEEEPGGGSGGCPGSGLCVEPAGALLDKLAVSLDDRLFSPRLPEPVASSPVRIVAAAAPTSPDHSPA
ncbi:Protein Dos [Microtus ochrogaster]|uniref:Protein Dos n=1 Tax=Microtus ochrogaster TaxID=79684 RepID=A0A8J6KUX4_MICOH|nr:Protein Dos [Microtus ochrogaster]